MPRIPIQSLVSARQSGVQLQPGAFAQTARATADLLSSVNGAAQMVKQQFDRAQDLKNRSDISEKKRQIREAQGLFQNELTKGNVDPAEWGPRWQKRLKQIEADIGLRDSKVPPVVKRAVGEAFKQFAGSSFIQISGAALKENQKRARQNFDRDYQFNAQNGDYAANDALVEANRDLLGDDYADDTLRTNRLMKRKDDIEFSRNNDPIGHIDRVKSGEFGLSKVQQQREIEAAERKRDRIEAENLAGIRELEQAGLIENEEDLKTRLEDDPYITEAKRKAYLKNYRSNQPLAPKDQFAIQDSIDNNVERFRKGEISSEEYEAEWVRIQSDVHSYGDRKGVGRFNSDLHNVRPSLFSEDAQDEAAARQRIKDLKPIQTTANALVKQRAEGLASIAYANQKNNETGLSGEELAGNAALKGRLDEHAILLRSALQSAMGDFIANYPGGGKPTEPELKEFLDKNADKINLEVLQKPQKEEPVTPRTSAEKAAQWLAPNSGAFRKRSDIPYNGVAANIRYNNPAAAYPRKADTKYGLIGYGILNGGKQGMHKIGRFPTPTHGAAANLDLFANDYVGMTVYDAVRKWRGNGGRGEKTVVPKGYDPQMRITKAFLNDRTKAVDFFKKMALHESPDFKGMSDSDWTNAWKMWKAGGATK